LKGTFCTLFIQSSYKFSNRSHGIVARYVVLEGLKKVAVVLGEVETWDIGARGKGGCRGRQE
jgi:hypothetical protein